jgi:hypothetical protein
VTSELLLAICPAVGVFIDLMFRLITRLDDLQISIRTRIVSAQTLDGAEGIRVLIHNRGHYPANVDWLRIESQRISLRLPLHSRSAISRGANDTCALALQDLFRAGFHSGDAIRAFVVLDLGHEFHSSWMRITRHASLAQRVSRGAAMDLARGCDS